jgi:uncharacterized protein YhaN
MAEKSIQEIDESLAELEVPDALIEKAELVENLYQELGSYQKAARDRIRLVTQRDLLRSEARDILSGLREGLTLEEAERLRLKKTDTVRIRELGGEYERLITKLETARHDIPRLSRLIRDLEKQLEGIETPPAGDDLKAALERALKYGALEDHFHGEFQDILGAERSLSVALGKQTLWSGSLEHMETLPVPSMETLDVFEFRFSEAQNALGQLQAEIKEKEEILAGLQGQIEELRLEREVPTEKDLEEARRCRQEGWMIVRRVWEAGEEASAELNRFIGMFQPARTLSDAYEMSVLRADELADRLRREADRVARKAKLLADRETLGSRCESLKRQLETARAELTEAGRAWLALWGPAQISPLSPREMRAWLQDLNAMRERARKIRERRVRAEDLGTQMERQRHALDRCLRSLSEPPAQQEETLSDLISRSRRVIEQQESIRNRKKQLIKEKEQWKKELEEAQWRLSSIEEALSQWKTRWSEAIGPLGLDGGAVPAEANAVMDDLKRLFDTLKEADILHGRIHGIDRDAEGFVARVSDLTGQLAPDLKGLPAAQAAAELNGRLNRARAVLSQRQGLQKQRHQAEEQRRKATGSAAEIRSRLDAMCDEAGRGQYDELAEAEKRSDKRRELESGLENLEEGLRKLSAGATVEAFVREALKVDADVIQTQIDRLTEEIDRLSEEKSALDQAIGRERNELGRMDGSSQAAVLAEETQMLLGRLENDVEKYIGLRLASAVLSQAIEKYREKHQAPVLRRAGELFSQLTVGSFQEIRVEFDEQSRPVLVGIRAGGAGVVSVEGMSDGTADQLYLALRLASLEEYLQDSEPIPFIVDDILIRFDNERASAALQVLGQLSLKTQVVFFTHHRHLVELAEKHVEPSLLFVHTLGV